MGPNSNTPNQNLAPSPQVSGGELPVNQPSQYNVGPNTTFNSDQNKRNQTPATNHEQLSAAEQLAQPAPTIPVPTSTASDAATTTSVSPVSTKSVDQTQLEKAWVTKAKTVIAVNQSDPYELAHQVALLVKGYLNKRYGKVISGKKQ